jgi:hypothetical protein
MTFISDMTKRPRRFRVVILISEFGESPDYLFTECGHYYYQNTKIGGHPCHGFYRMGLASHPAFLASSIYHGALFSAFLRGGLAHDCSSSWFSIQHVHLSVYSCMLFSWNARCVLSSSALLLLVHRLGFINMFWCSEPLEAQN